MEIEKQVVSLLHAEQLKMLGAPQDTAFVYYKNTGGEWKSGLWNEPTPYYVFKKREAPLVSAYTAQELGELLKGENALPTFFTGENYYRGQGWYWQGRMLSPDNESHARAEMYIQLHINK